jgi:hypothetical protein
MIRLYDLAYRDPDRCARVPGAPAFFRCTAERHAVIGADLGDGTAYGYSVATKALADTQRQIVGGAWTRTFTACCFSEAMPDGELAVIRTLAVQEIDRSVFDLARRLRWGL